MANKVLSFSLSLLGIFLVGFPLTSCSKNTSEQSNEKVVLKILNSEDYIYLNDPDNGYDEDDLTVQFEKYMSEEWGLNVSVVYETSDTNESMYNDLLSGRTTYDLVCTSDYMCQKFAREGLTTKIDRSLIPNYTKYCSDTIGQRLDDIVFKINDDEFGRLADYSIGYMWGTLGLLFNPEYEAFEDGVDPINDLDSFEGLWDQRYKGTMTIKDSMRDTIAVAIIHMYNNELTLLKEQFEEGLIDVDAYNSQLSYYFNIISNVEDEKFNDKLNEIKDSLLSLKSNIFGMEVDSGKQDMVTGKIGINLAWSGDAVYSMDQAEEEIGKELYYSLPKEGSNIWFDAWSMPVNENRSELTYQVACEFLNFISDPYYASLNMDYTGYTTFIGGDAILDIARDWYDIRTDVISYIDEEEEYYPLFYVDPFTQEETEVSFDDVHFEEDNDPDYDEVILYYYGEEENAIEYGLYNEILLIDPEWEEVDLSYFFNGTFDEYVDGIDSIFYTDYYKEENGVVGRQFYCQYPDEEAVVRCAIMDDYGNRNTSVLKIWESFKSNSLPTWAIVLFIVEIVLLIVGVGFIIQGKYIKKGV